MHCLGCGYNLRALDRSVCPECGRGFDQADPRTWRANERAVLPPAIGRWAGRLLLVHLPVLVLWCGFDLVRGEDVFIVLFVPCLLSVPLLVSCAMLWGFGRVGARATNRRHKLLVAFGLFCVCLLASYVTRWPFHAAFAVSRPALERLVQRAEQGQLPSGPVWAGVFRVERIDQRDGHWALWIETRTSGPDALVYASPAGGVPNSFNIWGHEQLDARWHIVNED